ncbi:unnamed protein product [Pleuronectes platessa]|uniref:Uncharacterized protein n=1 Tax=Pleuronectes platessa TaxID=8262 RepID=A0A9N7TKL9_PLEPL|nr:unnamed protein product [Pleuronectes platessa]
MGTRWHRAIKPRNNSPNPISTAVLSATAIQTKKKEERSEVESRLSYALDTSHLIIGREKTKHRPLKRYSGTVSGKKEPDCEATETDLVRQWSPRFRRRKKQIEKRPTARQDRETERTDCEKQENPRLVSHAEGGKYKNCIARPEETGQ